MNVVVFLWWQWCCCWGGNDDDDDDGGGGRLKGSGANGLLRLHSRGKQNFGTPHETVLVLVVFVEP